MKKYSQPVFVVNYNNEIEEMTYAEYLTSYYGDTTTSPRGAENRRQTASVLVNDGEVFDKDLNDRGDLSKQEIPEGMELKWAVYSWGIGGHGPAKLDSVFFDTEEEAEEEILRGMEWDFYNKSTDAPHAYFTRGEAEEFIKENAPEVEPEDE